MLVRSGLPGHCWLLPCAVPGGGVASWAVSLSSAPVAAGVVDSLGLTFYLCSDWSGAGCGHTHWPLPSLLPVLTRVAATQGPFASVSKSCNGAKTPYLSCAEQKCCCSSAKMLPPLRWWRMGFNPYSQVLRPGLAHLPSTGLLQVFTVLFKTKFIEQLGLREQSFFGYVSGVSELQSSGQHLEHCLLMLPWRSSVVEEEGEGVSELARIQCQLSQGTLSSVRALLYLPLIFMLITFYNFYG